ncbi:MAG: glycosyltransferase family 4 protein [Verrucomicrobiae bacterium]|nr:glycosyltransferase family 4 protein [Verrucomicrobiae bacterium]
MRVLHLNNEKSWRGGERQTLLLAKGLQDIGVESVIGCRPGTLLEQYASNESLPTLSVPSNGFAALWAIGRAAHHFDLIHCHTGRTHSLAAIAGVFHRTPLVVTRRVGFLPANNWFNRFKFQKAASVACISQFILNRLLEWGADRAKLRLIRSAVTPFPAEWLTAAHRTACRSRLGISPDARVVGNIAALTSEKDHQTFIRAARLLVDQMPDVKFVILGDGELRPTLERLSAQLGLKRHLFMPGFVPRAEQFIPAFDVFVMTSIIEGLGSIILDCFAAGVPVVATAGGGLSETVYHEQTGLVTGVGDYAAICESISRILRDHQLAARLCRAAREWVQRECTVERMSKAYLAMYRDIMAPNRGDAKLQPNRL